jgi:hypothetical protein
VKTSTSDSIIPSDAKLANYNIPSKPLQLLSKCQVQGSKFRV